MEEEDKEYIETLTKGFFYSTEQFDKAVLFVSSGALAISMTFIEKIVPLKDAHCKQVLVFSWLFEALTILLFTINHYISKKAFNKRLENYFRDKQNKEYDWLVKRINGATIFSLAIGLILLIIFIYINI